MKKCQDLGVSLSNCISLIENIVLFPWGLMKKHEMRSYFSFIEKNITGMANCNYKTSETEY